MQFPKWRSKKQIVCLCFCSFALYVVGSGKSEISFLLCALVTVVHATTRRSTVAMERRWEHKQLLFLQHITVNACAEAQAFTVICWRKCQIWRFFPECFRGPLITHPWSRAANRRSYARRGKRRLKETGKIYHRLSHSWFEACAVFTDRRKKPENAKRGKM